MSRGIRTARPLVVWLAVTAAAVLSAKATPAAWRATDAGTGPDAVADLLVAASTTGLAVALAWLWLVTTATVGEVLAGRVRPRGGATRRVVLAACGVAVVAGTALPAGATSGDGRELLAGLTLPDRAVAPAAHQRHQPARTAEREPENGDAAYVVRPGDSLWSIARTHPDRTGSVELRWRAIWQANRDLVGDDPDLILPGQALRLPGGNDHDRHDQDGD